MNLESARMLAVQSPIIPTVGALIQQTPGTISLGQGVVSYPPPSEAIAQITQFLAEPDNHKYQAVEGIPELRQAIALKLKAENGIVVDGNSQIVVTAGSNMGFVNALLAIADPGDEVILQVPYYFNHEMAIRMANCQPVLVSTDDRYQLCPDAIRQAITPRTKAVVTVSPNNPSGAVYGTDALREVNQICREHGIYHMSDEAYEYFTYDRASHFSPGSIPDSYPYTISIFSLSKAYGFASWRVGYMVIPAHLRAAVMKIQDTIAICAAVVSQHAAVGALQAGRGYCQTHLEAIAQVRQVCLQELAAIADLCTLPPAQGAFYFLLKVHTDMDSFELVKRLITEHKVAAIPGSTFGLETGCYLRVVYGALQPKTVIEGMGRLVRGIRAIVG
ncbi:MAG TPA: pyridoxal phosphate-dependent aminotransferase [Coleofasciculaceae cyanobacterium]|jgi:aspartate/methionine/tyrosine aminotransferase